MTGPVWKLGVVKLQIVRHYEFYSLYLEHLINCLKHNLKTFLSLSRFLIRSSLIIEFGFWNRGFIFPPYVVNDARRNYFNFLSINPEKDKVHIFHRTPTSNFSLF